MKVTVSYITYCVFLQILTYQILYLYKRILWDAKVESIIVYFELHWNNEEFPAALVGDTPTIPQRDRILTTKESWGPTYVISIEVSIESAPLDGQFLNIFHFTNDENGDACCEMGERTPMLILKYGGPYFLICNLDIRPTKNSACKSKQDPIPLKQWILIRMEQYYENVIFCLSYLH